MRLDDLNRLDEAAAIRELLRCCGSSRWARGVAAARPYRSLAALVQTGDEVWSRLDRADILEAFAAHPPIGASLGRQPDPAVDAAPAHGSAEWSEQEQSGAGAATDDVRRRLAAGNRAYEARFGYIFIICATGKSAAEMLKALDARLGHTADEELPIAAAEQRQITQLRLAKLVGIQPPS